MIGGVCEGDPYEAPCSKKFAQLWKCKSLTPTHFRGSCHFAFLHSSGKIQHALFTSKRGASSWIWSVGAAVENNGTYDSGVESSAGWGGIVFGPLNLWKHCASQRCNSNCEGAIGRSFKNLLIVPIEPQLPKPKK